MTVELPETPENRKEQYLANIAGQDVAIPEEPANRIEAYLAYIAENGGGGGGGTSYTAGDGIDISDHVISVDTDTIQPKLTAGTNITISNNVISATGGGSITPVQTTGTSTSDVMSQDAVTKLIFPDIANKPNRIVIGSGSVNANNGLAINANISSTYSGSIAISADSSSPATIASSARSEHVIIGTDAYVGQGSGCVSIGKSANSTGGGPATGQNVAIGYYSSTNSKYNSVALGAESYCTRDGEVNIGTGSAAHGYGDTKYRVLGGVHDPVDAHDAATKGYVDGIKFDISDVYSAAYAALEQGGGAVSITTAQYDAIEAAIRANKFISAAIDNTATTQEYISLTATSANITADGSSRADDWEIRFMLSTTITQALYAQWNEGAPTVELTEIELATVS